MSTSWVSTTWATSCGLSSCCHACRRTQSERHTRTGSHTLTRACINTYTKSQLSTHPELCRRACTNTHHPAHNRMNRHMPHERHAGTHRRMHARCACMLVRISTTSAHQPPQPYLPAWRAVRLSGVLPAWMCLPADASACLPARLSSPPPRSPVRVVNVSSLAHTFGRINFDDLMCKKDYQPWVAYGEAFTHRAVAHTAQLDWWGVEVLSECCNGSSSSSSSTIRVTMLHDNTTVGVAVRFAPQDRQRAVPPGLTS
jgi:hypothetical protein